MQEPSTLTRAGTKTKTLGGAVVDGILAFIKKCMVAGGQVQASKLALRPVRIEQNAEVIRR